MLFKFNGNLALATQSYIQAPLSSWCFSLCTEHCAGQLHITPVKIIYLFFVVHAEVLRTAVWWLIFEILVVGCASVYCYLTC